MSPVEQHPPRDVLTAFMQGRLSPEDQARCEEHVSRCSQCADSLAQVPDDTLLNALRTSDETIDQQGTPAADARGASGTPGANASGSQNAVGSQIPPELADHPRYQVLGLLGSGGMGDVYLAEHRLMERKVALKVLRREMLSNAAAVDRFRFEVRAAGKLSHPNIVQAYDADQAGDLHFLVMEYVDGVSLDRQVRGHGVLTVRDACTAVRMAAQGLQHAHERKMVHRDIKPANLMAVNRGAVKILDFGLSRFFSEQQTASGPSGRAGRESLPSDLTTDGTILGTPDYIAPEQVANAKGADIRADIYSLGCTLYFLLTGQPPFATGTVAEKLQAHGVRLATPLNELRADVPLELMAIVERMMAKDPKDRFQEPKEVAKALQPFAGGKGTTSVAVASGELTPLSSANPLSLDLLPSSSPLTTRGGPSKPSRDQALYMAGYGVAGAFVLALGLMIASSRLGCSTDNPIEGDLAAPKANQIDNFADNRANGNVAQASETPAIDQVAERKPTPLVSNNDTRQILYVIPKDGVWWPDYWPVRQALIRGGCAVKVASSKKGLCRVAQGGGGQDVLADYSVGEVNATDYAAIVFGGVRVDDLCEGTSGRAVANLINKALENGRFVTAICAGQTVLVHHGTLDGRMAAEPTNPDARGFVRMREQGHNVSWNDQRIVRDGLLITGSDEHVAAEFAEAVLRAIQK